MLSWVRRVAARYDLDAQGLVAVLCPPRNKVHLSRIKALDWTGKHGLDHVLAAAARLDPGRITALRLVAENPPSAGLLHRAGTVWCAACMRDDVAQRGEVHERAVWRLGWCLACTVHGCRLSEVCPSCLTSRCEFSAVSGRLRLVCGHCRNPVDTVPAAKGGFSSEEVAAVAAVHLAPTIDPTVLALQEALLTASSTGTAPPRSIGFGMDAEALLSIAHSVAIPFAWPVRSQRDWTVGHDQDQDVPGVLPIVVLHRCLGFLAAVLNEVAPSWTRSADRTATTTMHASGVWGQLAMLFECSSGRDRDELCRKALAWELVLGAVLLGMPGRRGECVRRAVDEVTQPRQATKLAVVELRRMRARRARRATLVRLRRRHEERRGK